MFTNYTHCTAHRNLDVIVEVETVDYSAEEAQTRNYPGCPAEIEVLTYSVWLDDDTNTQLSDRLATAIFNNNMDEISEELLEEVESTLQAEYEEAQIARWEH